MKIIYSTIVPTGTIVIVKDGLGLTEDGKNVHVPTPTYGGILEDGKYRVEAEEWAHLT